jgi:hypothetical protein
MDDWTVLDGEQFESIPAQYPNEETRDNALPNIAVYDILRKRLYAMAGGAAHIGTVSIHCTLHSYTLYTILIHYILIHCI